jgi:hypothetical protein
MTVFDPIIFFFVLVEPGVRVHIATDSRSSARYVFNLWRNG